MHRRANGSWFWAPVAVFCFSGETQAQIKGMATTDDASVLYFATPFRLAGSSEPATSKIYVYDSSGFRLYTDQFPNAYTTTIQKPWVSGDGSVVAYNGTYSLTNICGFMRECSTTYTQTAVQSGPAATVVLNGPAAISANGRFALIPGPVLLDLTSGGQTAIPQPSGVGSLVLDSVASDGTVLFSDPVVQVLYVWRQDLGLRRIPAANTSAVMNDGATSVLYTSGITLYLYDLASGTSRIFANGSGQSISRDGRWAAFVSPVNGIPQAWAVAAAGAPFLQLTNEAAGVTSAVISGNGNLVFVATASNAILKFDLAAGTSTQIVALTPAPVYDWSGVPGSLGSISAVGLAPQTVTATPPLPLSLAGYQVLLNGMPAPLVSISPSAATYQIPWETPVIAFATVQLKSPDPNPIFEAVPGSSFITPFLPEFLTSPCVTAFGAPAACIVATHADGSAVTSDKPAAPGETVNLFATGLGAVSPPVATGAAAPANPPAVVQHPFACQLVEYGLGAPFTLGDLRMLATELAPGEVGTYRVTVQLPATTGTLATAFVNCQGSDYYAPGWIFVTPARTPFGSGF